MKQSEKTAENKKRKQGTILYRFTTYFIDGIVAEKCRQRICSDTTRRIRNASVYAVVSEIAVMVQCPVAELRIA
ncbi:hypothetical protein DICVIV_01915 [Dictyocaulus viviparus]|uniref:Uncharacterized protein n=1 Tax=Dictyocaulus viviparus TaxID=29172 RepID=A0A0D8Y7H8_DICVI|nr:hypothetical protein DICVIV_01915 [Dictyocaulus viviparus]